jgi:hypothetical protein
MFSRVHSDAGNAKHCLQSECEKETWKAANRWLLRPWRKPKPIGPPPERRRKKKPPSYCHELGNLIAPASIIGLELFLWMKDELTGLILTCNMISC